MIEQSRVCSCCDMRAASRTMRIYPCAAGAAEHWPPHLAAAVALYSAAVQRQPRAGGVRRHQLVTNLQRHQQGHTHNTNVC